MIRILFVGTTENRYFIEDNSSDTEDMPPLMDKNGEIFIQDNHLTDLEKNKTELFKLLQMKIGSLFYYNTVDPSYSNEKKIDTDDPYYLGHYSCLLEELNSSLHNRFDYIVITNCYQDLFTKTNVDKLNKLSKNYNKNNKFMPSLYIIRGVKYNINDYMKNNLGVEFIC